jgi:hypothetical protein
VSLHPDIAAVLAGDSEGCIVTGDCLEIMADMPDGCVDAVVTDPPYGAAFDGKKTKHIRHATGGYASTEDSDIGPRTAPEMLRLCLRAVVFSGTRLMFCYPRPYEIGCVYCPAGAGLGRWGFTVMHPMLFYGVGLPHTRTSASGFTSNAQAPRNGHPCPKPPLWMEWAVKKCSMPGDLILDPFVGSGTTCVAAKKLGRRWIGIEIDPKYAKIARNRVASTPRPLFTETPDAKAPGHSPGLFVEPQP